MLRPPKVLVGAVVDGKEEEPKRGLDWAPNPPKSEVEPAAVDVAPKPVMC